MRYTDDYMRMLYVMGMGYGTEGGQTPYKITVCGKEIRDAGVLIGYKVKSKSGYSIGAIQRDFGQMEKEDVRKFVKKVAKWLDSEGLKFSFVGTEQQVEDEMVKRLMNKGSALSVNKNIVPEQDLAKINNYLAVEKNQEDYFLTVERPFMNERLFGKYKKNGERVEEQKCVRDFMTSSDYKDKFSGMSESDQIRTLGMLSKVVNQGGTGALKEAYKLMQNIPAKDFNADNIKKKLYEAFDNKDLKNGILRMDCVGKVLDRINRSPILAELRNAGNGMEAFNEEAVKSKGDLVLLKILMKNAPFDDKKKGKIANPEITKFIDDVDAKRGALLKKDSKALGVNKDGVKFIVDLKSRNLDTIKKTANGWEPASADEFIKKVAIGKGKKSKETWALVEPGDIKKTVAPETQKVNGETVREAVRPEEGWGSKMKGYMQKFLDKYYAPPEAKSSEPAGQPKADKVAATAQNVEKDNTQGMGKDLIKEFGKLAPDAPVAQQKQAAINASVAQMLLAGSNKSPEEQAKIMEIANRITADHIQSGKEIEKAKLYDPQAEPTRVVRTFTMEELQKSQNQEKGIERQRSMEYGV